MQKLCDSSKGFKKSSLRFPGFWSRNILLGFLQKFLSMLGAISMYTSLVTCIIKPSQNSRILNIEGHSIIYNLCNNLFDLELWRDPFKKRAILYLLTFHVFRRLKWPWYGHAISKSLLSLYQRLSKDIEADSLRFNFES